MNEIIHYMQVYIARTQAPRLRFSAGEEPARLGNYMVCILDYGLGYIDSTLALSSINTGSTPKKGFIMKPGFFSD